MNIVKRVSQRFLKDCFIRLVLELILTTLFFNINLFIGLLFFAVVLFELILCKDNIYLLYAFLFFTFNDEILVLDFLKGSISRIIIIIIILKSLIYIFKRKLWPKDWHIKILVFFGFSVLMGLNNFGEIFVLLTNIISIVLLSISIKLNNKNEIDKFIEQMCIVIVTSVLCGIIYGLCFGNFLIYEQDNEIIYRFKGSFEPNFMAMYINLGIMALLTIKDMFKNWSVYLVLSFMINGLLLTLSVTGLGIFFINGIFYFIYNKKEWRVILKGIMCVFIITLIFYSTTRLIINEKVSNRNVLQNIEQKIDSQNSIGKKSKKVLNDYKEDGLNDRSKRIINQAKNGKIDDLTSGRTALAKTFMNASFNRPIINILFGNNPVNKRLYSDFFGRNCYSHNSFIDILYNFGVIGFFVVIFAIIKRLKNNIFLNINISKSKYSKNLFLFRIMLLINSLALTMYSSRIFLIYFLL